MHAHGSLKRKIRDPYSTSSLQTMLKSLKKLFSTSEKNPTAEVVAAPVAAPTNTAPDRPAIVVERSALIKRGNVFLAERNLREAENCYRQALAIDPTHVAAHVTLGFVLKEQKLFDEAKRILTKVVQLDPQNADGFYMLGAIAKEQDDLEGTIENFNRTLAIKPDFEWVYWDFCNYLISRNQSEAAKNIISKGIEKFPANANFHFYLGNLYLDENNNDAAVASYRAALAIKPEYPEVLSNLGNALKAQGNLDEAVKSLRAALALKPDFSDAFSNLLFALLYHGGYAPDAVFAEHLRFAQLFEAPLKQRWPLHANRRDPHKRLKVGYVSGDFRNHSVAFFIEPVLETHDKSAFEIFCYYNHVVHDHVTERLQTKVEHWLSCAGMTDDQLAARIVADGIDILVDLSGHTACNRLLTFARKPAPIQATWIGYQATTGLASIDYRITDAAMDPPGTTEQFHSETLLRIPASAQFQPPVGGPSVNPLPALSTAQFTFGCLNNLAKISQEAVHLWSRILTALPHARLMLGNVAGAETKERLIAMFALENIGEDRLLLQPKVPLGDYLELHHQIDLGLDTFPYNGGTTTLHSLNMGVPVIALAGDTPVSRAGVAILSGAGLSEFATYSEDEYVARAIEVAGDLTKLNEIRQTLRERASSLFSAEPEQVTRPLEEAYRRIWTTWCNS